MSDSTSSRAEWDAFVRQHPRGHLLQLSAWAALKEAFGWQSERIILREGDTISAGAQVLYKPSSLPLTTMAYLPFGGYVSHDAQWPALWKAVRDTTRQHHAAFLKYEPGHYLADAPPPLAAWGFQPSARTVQPPNTIYITLDDDDTLLARMNQGTRRKIRQALKNNITCYEASAEQVSQFTALMTTTGTRNAFGVHDPTYYEMAYRLFVPQDAALILASHEGDTLAGVFVFALGNTAWYLYGASSNHKRDLMGSYGVQWAAIQWARARGCRYYDMWGIPDADEATLETEFETRSDGLWGVYGFKRGWGGTIRRSLGAWDIAYNRVVYAGYKLITERKRLSARRTNTSSEGD